MQQADYKNLQNDLVEKLTGRLTEKKEVIQASVEEEFKRMTDEQKIMSLSPDEVDLLVAFRRWSASAGSASGVFHWCKQYGK